MALALLRGMLCCVNDADGGKLMRILPRPMRVLLPAGTLVLAACTLATPIRSILDHPREYADKTVVVKGEVKEIFSLIVVKYFVIDDGTGRITVITGKPLPAKGERLKVKGTVREAFSLGDQSLTLIVEEPESDKPAKPTEM
jgi:hypothetical protein